jgi:hypothetical protein
MTTPPAPRTYMELSFRPTVDLISATRRFVCAYCEPLLRDDDLVSRVGLATHELLENILKYATDGRTLARVCIEGEGPEQRLSIETTSAVTPARKAGLEEIFAEMEKVADPAAYYQLTMRRALRRRQGSGLGLARVWAEAEMGLTLAFLGDSATIIATTNIPGQAAP